MIREVNVNFIIDSSVSMYQYMEDINYAINNCCNFKEASESYLNNPYLLELDSNNVMCKGEVFSFSDRIYNDEFIIKEKPASVRCHNSIKTNLGEVIKLMNNLKSVKSLNFIIIDGPITDNNNFEKEAQKMCKNEPAFFSLSLGPICDISECKLLKGYGYQLKDCSTYEARKALRNFFSSIIGQYISYFPSMTLDPLVNQFRPKMPEIIKPVYEIDFK